MKTHYSFAQPFTRRFLTRAAGRVLMLLAASGLGALQLSATILPSATSLGLNPGQQYAFVFVTSTLTAATSNNIATYNTFVQNLANANSIGTSLSMTWNAAVAVSASIKPNTNAPVPVGVKVFLLDGTMVANGGTNRFYHNVNHLAPIQITELGTGFTGTDRVWTGASDGNGNESGSGLLGAANPVFGHANGTNWDRGFTDSWAREGNNANSNLYRLYAVSNVLTVTNTVTPEPSTWALMVSGLAVAAIRRRRNQAQ